MQDHFAKNYTVSQSFVDEKMQALHALALIAYNTGVSFVPYIHRSLNSLVFLLRYVHPHIRKSALRPAESFLTVVSLAYPAKTGKWIAGLDPQQQPLSDETNSLLDTFMPLFIKNILSDHDKEVVYSTCESIKQILKVLGPSALTKYLDELFSALMSVLLKNTTCQLLYEDSSEDEAGFEGDDEDEQDNKTLFQNTCELLGEMANVLKGFFSPKISETLEHLVPYLEPSQSNFLRQEVTGSIAEIVQNMGSEIVVHLDLIMPIILKAMNDPYAPAASNAVYCCGILCEQAKENATKFYPEIFTFLPNLLKPNTYSEICDNAAGLIGRIISTSASIPGIILPTEQLLPALLQSIPLKKDFEENKAVYGALFTLYSIQHPSIAPYVPKLVEAFCMLITNPTIQIEIKKDMAKFVKSVQMQYPGQTEQLLHNIPPENRDFLNTLI